MMGIDLDELDPNSMCNIRFILDAWGHGTCQTCGREMVPLFSFMLLIRHDGEWIPAQDKPREGCGLCIGKLLDELPVPDRQRGKE